MKCPICHNGVELQNIGQNGQIDNKQIVHRFDCPYGKSGNRHWFLELEDGSLYQWIGYEWHPFQLGIKDLRKIGGFKVIQP